MQKFHYGKPSWNFTTVSAVLNFLSTVIFMETVFTKSCLMWHFLSTGLWYIKFWLKIIFANKKLPITWQQHFTEKTLSAKMFGDPFFLRFWKNINWPIFQIVENCCNCERHFNEIESINVSAVTIIALQWAK